MYALLKKKKKKGHFVPWLGQEKAKDIQEFDFSPTGKS